MKDILNKFERAIIFTLILLMILTVLGSTLELTIIFIKHLINPPFLCIDLNKMLEIFGFFLMVMIGLELLNNMKTYYFEKEKIHADGVFLIALVSLSRKVIIMDYKEATPEILYGISAIIIAISIGYFLIRRAVSSSSK